MTSLGRWTLSLVVSLWCSACTQDDDATLHPASNAAYMAGSYYSEPFDPS